jgi:hypothetical protein
MLFRRRKATPEDGREVAGEVEVVLGSGSRAASLASVGGRSERRGIGMR